MEDIIDKMQNAMEDISKYVHMLDNAKNENEIKEAVEGISKACKILKQIREEVN